MGWDKLQLGFVFSFGSREASTRSLSRNVLASTGTLDIMIVTSMTELISIFHLVSTTGKCVDKEIAGLSLQWAFPLLAYYLRGTNSQIGTKSRRPGAFEELSI
jgi:hypothetical protein